MPRITLTAQEIDELISSYISARSKLQFQIGMINQTIDGLKEQKKSAPAARKLRKQTAKEERFMNMEADASNADADVPAVKEPKTRGSAKILTRKEKQPKEKKAGKQGKRVRRIKSDGYRLSYWDEFILNTISEKRKPLINSELYDACLSKSMQENLNLNETQLQGKIARSLHKLSNKRTTLRKFDIPGRGYAYGLGEWFFAKSGKLKKVFLKGLPVSGE